MLLIGTFIITHAGAIGFAIKAALKYLVIGVEWRVNNERDIKALQEKIAQLEQDVTAAHIKIRQKDQTTIS